MLYLVATPIGNLADITLRALDVLRSVDVIAAEDTRHTAILLRHYGIQTALLSFHEHNEARRTAELLQRLQAGANVAVVSDAGMPGVSDPGSRLLRACAAAGIPWTIVPGPSAVLTALIGSGFPADCFHFGGFLPAKSGGRERAITAALARANDGIPSVLFESPHRLLKTLAVFAEKAPAHPLCVAREMTKRFEEFRTGPATVLLAHYTAHPPRGEIVLVIAATPRTRPPGDHPGPPACEGAACVRPAPPGTTPRA